MLRKHLGRFALVASLAATLAAPTTAAAFTNVTVGQAVNVDMASATLSIGSAFSCINGTMDGTVADDWGAGLGGEIAITAKTLTGCEAYDYPATITPASGTWTLTVFGATTGTLTGFGVTITHPAFTCQYSGTLTSDMDLLGYVDLYGTLTRTAGTAPFCPATAHATTVYRARDVYGDPVGL